MKITQNNEISQVITKTINYIPTDSKVLKIIKIKE